jgi:hypothetical protein
MYPHLNMPTSTPAQTKTNASLKEGIDDALDYYKSTGIPVDLNHNGVILQVYDMGDNTYEILLERYLTQHLPDRRLDVILKENEEKE